MDIAKLVLEFVRVLLAWPVIVLALGVFFFIKFHKAIDALIHRIASIKFPGGGELVLPQATRNVLATEVVVTAVTDGETAPGAEVATAEQRLKSANERARLWEYQYLNFFLVPRTQVLLDWLANRAPTAYATYDSWMTNVVPNPLEREAMINALRNHHLIEIAGDMITVNPKGHEYMQWRGPVQRFLSFRLGTANAANVVPADAGLANVAAQVIADGEGTSRSLA